MWETCINIKTHDIRTKQCLTTIMDKPSITKPIVQCLKPCCNKPFSKTSQNLSTSTSIASKMVIMHEFMKIFKNNSLQFTLTTFGLTRIRFNIFSTKTSSCHKNLSTISTKVSSKTLHKAITISTKASSTTLPKNMINNILHKNKNQSTLPNLKCHCPQ